MTPQLAAMLTIHEEELPDAEVEGRRFASGYGSLIPFPRPAVRAEDGDEQTLPSLLRRESHRRRLLAAADVVGATAALALALTLLGEARPGPAILAGMPLVVLLFKVAGLYDRDQLRIVRSTLDEAPALAQLTGLYALTVSILHPLLSDQPMGGSEIAALWGLSFVAILGGRVAARALDARGSAFERCLVIGDNMRAERVREKLTSSSARAAVIATLPVHDDVNRLGSLESLRQIVRELQIHRIIIAPTTADAEGVVELIRVAKAAGVRVSVLPRMLEVVGSSVEFEDVDGLTMLGVRPFGLSRSSRALKRGFDLVAASIGLLAVAPIMAVVALAIRLESKGPVLFRQVRVGRDGRHFHILKFRSMVVDADAQKERLRGLNEVGKGMFKIAADPRVTRVGSILRRTSLDELPQVFNVLRGEMSLVGPRPLVTDEDAQVLGLDRSRLHLTPGMTGPWQILGVRVPMQEMVGIDYHYVASWSLWLDVKVLMRTVRHVARSGNV
jgi:exopolysaccharide biosynthesis polyprenyl glycosylphosphotransferase